MYLCVVSLSFPPSGLHTKENKGEKKAKRGGDERKKRPFSPVTAVEGSKKRAEKLNFRILTHPREASGGRGWGRKVTNRRCSRFTAAEP